MASSSRCTLRFGMPRACMQAHRTTHARDRRRKTVCPDPVVLGLHLLLLACFSRHRPPTPHASERANAAWTTATTLQKRHHVRNDGPRGRRRRWRPRSRPSVRRVRGARREPAVRRVPPNTVLRHGVPKKPLAGRPQARVPQGRGSTWPRRGSDLSPGHGGNHAARSCARAWGGRQHRRCRT